MTYPGPPITAEAVAATAPDDTPTNVQAALDALALGSRTWQAEGTADLTTDPGIETAWETTGALGLAWTLTGATEGIALLPDGAAAWWHASACADLTLWDGDPDDGGVAVAWPADVLAQLVVGDQAIAAAPDGWGHHGDPIGGDLTLRATASGLILAGHRDGGDALCYCLGQVQGVTTPDLLVRVNVTIRATVAAPAEALS